MPIPVRLRSLATAALVAVSLSSTACVEPVDDDAVADEIAVGEAALGGWRFSFQRGIVAAVRRGDAVRHAALPLGPQQVLVHRAWADGVPATDLTIEVRDINGNVTAHAVRWVQPLLDGTATVLVTEQPLTPFFSIDRTRTAAQLTGLDVRCTGYVVDQSNQTAVHAFVTQRITGGTDAALTLASVNNSTVNATTDRGTPCYDVTPGTVAAIGYVIDDGGVAKLRRYSALDGELARFAPLLAHGANPSAPSRPTHPLRITTQYLLGLPAQFGGLPAVDSCLDVPDGSTTPGTGVNYYPCHTGINQRFVIENVPAGTPARVFGFASGLCLTAGATGAAVTLETCTSAANQRWRIDTWVPVVTLGTNYQRLAPESAPTTCLSVRNWNRNQVRPLETAACPAATVSPSPYVARWRWN